MNASTFEQALSEMPDTPDKPRLRFVAGVSRRDIVDSKGIQLAWLEPKSAFQVWCMYVCMRGGSHRIRLEARAHIS